jgi:lysophospholipase L1-like esterase
VDSFPTAAFEAAAGAAPFNVIIFNNGLHALQWSPDKVTDGQIEAVLRNMVHAFRKGAPKAKLVWAATTPQTAKGHPVTGLGELNPIVVRINTLAGKVMKEEDVDCVDLYALLKEHLDLAAGDQYHWTGDAYQLIAEALRKKCDAVLPLRRVLARPR